MYITLSQNSDTPIYQQIEDQIRAQILSGDLKSGDMIPSLRSLAKDLRVSVVTVQKAYDDLINTGFIKTGHGIGTFVCEIDPEFIKEEILKRIEEHISKASELALKHGIDKETVCKMLDLYFEE